MPDIPDPDWYVRRCEYAATRQGLDPVVARLRDEGILVEVEQTGGFVMAAVVRTAGGVIAIIDGGPEFPAYMVGTHPGTVWDDGEDDESITGEMDLHSLDEMLRAVRDAIAHLATL